MASKPSAHWNMFPFMTAPRTKYYSAQLQSPLFRLPRELRNKIYALYMSENDGYHYDYLIRKLSYENPSEPTRQAVRLGLRMTCRIAAEEMKDITLPPLNFYGTCSEADGVEFMGLRSRAGRFQCLLTYVERQKCRILVCVGHMLQHEDFLDLYSRYPSVKSYFHAPLRRAMADQTDELGASESFGENILSQTFSDSLQYALLLAKTRNPAEFAKRACATFGMGECPLRAVALRMVQTNLFAEGALSEVFHWQPAPWSLAEDSELSRIEAFLNQPGDTDTRLPTTSKGLFYFPDMTAHLDAVCSQWFFSAAAIAIDFLRRTSKRQQANTRNVTLYENFKSVGRPECHALGFIAFCIENPKLHITRHISLLNTLLPAGAKRPPHARDAWILSCQCLEVIVPWIEEAVSLPAHGMPKDAFELVIDGTVRESSEAWEILKDAAARQEALLRQYQVSGSQPKPRLLPPRYTHPALAPWSLPVQFPQMIRDIAQGRSIVRYDGDVGELWDQEKFFSERKAWTEDQWAKDWEDNVDRGISTDRWRYIANRYRVTPQALRSTYTVVRNGRVIQSSNRAG